MQTITNISLTELNPHCHWESGWAPPAVDPWPEPVDGNALLHELQGLLSQFVVLPEYAGETLALWILNTYAFELREVSTYIGLESPEKRCGKTTLLAVLSELVNRPVVAANISPPAFFRVIEETRPTLLIDEADTFLQGNDELRGILNAGYSRKTAFVVRVANVRRKNSAPTSPQYLPGTELDGAKLEAAPASDADPNRAGEGGKSASRLVRFSCWCPKIMAAIGNLPEVLSDRCIVIRMQRKTFQDQCQRLGTLETTELKRRCARFVLDHSHLIATTRPEAPKGLHDRAVDIWEPLLVLADLAGGDWPQKARAAAVGLTASTQDSSPLCTLLTDILQMFMRSRDEKLFSRTLAACLNFRLDRPWAEPLKGRRIDELWLARQLRPHGIRPKTIWIGDESGRGYELSQFNDAARRYVPQSEFRAMEHELATKAPLMSKEDRLKSDLAALAMLQAQAAGLMPALEGLPKPELFQVAAKALAEKLARDVRPTPGQQKGETKARP